MGLIGIHQRHLLCSPAGKANRLRLRDVARETIRCYGWPFRFFYTSNVQSLMVAEPHMDEYSLPWPHYSRPIARRAPLLHRLAGQFLLHRRLKQLGSAFSMADFLLGVSDAVQAFTYALSERRYHDLEAMLSPSLYKFIDVSLHNLPVGATVNMDTSVIKGQTICSVNAIFGDATLDDEHSVEWLGQKVVTSKSEMMKLIEGDSRFTFKNARALGIEATLNRLEFVLGVSFFTRTCFKVESNTGQLIQGHDHYVDDFHYWEFSSLVHCDREYPLEWIITNINNFL